MPVSSATLRLFPRGIFDGFMDGRSTPTESVKKRAKAMLEVDEPNKPKRAQGPVKLVTFEVK